MAQTLIEALTDFLGGNQWIASNVTGGVWNSNAPNSETTTYPYATLVKADSRVLGILGGTRWVDWPTVNVEVRSSSGAEAGRVGEALRDLIMGPRANLVWLGGREAGRYLPGGESSELEEGKGLDGADVWVFRVPIVFTTARGA